MIGYKETYSWKKYSRMNLVINVLAGNTVKSREVVNE